MAVRRSFVPVLSLALLLGGAFRAPMHAQVVTARAYGACDEPRVNTTLRAAVVQGDTAAVNYANMPFNSNWRMATSFLAPSGRMPTERIALQEWRCQFAPFHISDEDSAKAWCEGAQGEGVGEILAFTYAGESSRVGIPQTPLEIWAGYGKSEALFRANGRPHQVRVWAVAIPARRFPGQNYERFSNSEARPIGSVEVELRDVNGWQPLSYPQVPGSPYQSHQRVLLGIEILSVYPGTRYTDTCISEIRPAYSR